MSDQQGAYGYSASDTPRWVMIAMIVLAGISLVALGIGITAASRASSVEQTANAALKQNVDALNQRLAKADETNGQMLSDLRVVTDKLKLTGEQLIAARRQSKIASASYNKKLTGLETSVKSELATKASSEDVTKLNGDVTGVKGDLDETKNSLQMAKGELGTLIARNHEEIDQLRRMGQRDYFEFTLPRKGGVRRVGSIQVELRDTNPKRNQFSIVVVADDNRFEKKNRSVNEPIYFYTTGSRAALELVVNKVTKRQATGYLSVPKVSSTAASGSSSDR